MAVDGSMAYFGSGSYFHIVDFGMAGDPRLIAKIRLPKPILDVKLQNNNIAYIAAGQAGLRIIDVANPSNPVELAKLDTPVNASGLDISGTTLYLADAGVGLRIIDISIPGDPKEIKFIETGGSALNVAIGVNYAYVADGSGGLRVIDITIPQQPNEIAHYETAGAAVDVAVRGTYAFVAVENAGMLVLDISNPWNPTEIGQFDGYKSITAIAVDDNSAYVTDSQVGLGIIDITNFYAPKEASALPMEGNPADLALSGTHVYVADGHRGLKKVDVSRPDQPSLRDVFPTGSISRSVAVLDNHAYLAQAEVGVRVIEVADPSQPDLIGAFDLKGCANDIAAKDDFAYVANCENGIRIIRISDPAQPVTAGFFDQNIDARSIIIEEKLAYVADAFFGLRILDITDPSQPLLIGSHGIQGGQTEALTRLGNHVFLAGGNEGLRIIDVTNPAQPVEVGFFQADGAAKSVAVEENYVYLGYLQNKLRIVDISDPTDPSQVGQFDLQEPAHALVVKGRYVYIAGGNRGLRVIDVMAPSHPVEVGYYVTESAAVDVALADQLIYLVDQNTGLYILKFDIASINVAPESPILIAPYNNSFANTMTPQFSWHIPRDDNGDMLHFTIQLNADGDWNRVDYHIDSRSDQTGFSPAPPVPQGSGAVNYESQFELSEGKWRWRVSAWDGLAASDFSDTWQFTIDTTAPVIQQFVFKNPGYGENWFSPIQDSIVITSVLYSELFPAQGKLSGVLLPDTMQISNLLGGYDQEIELQFSIANQSDGEYSVFFSIADSAGNSGSIAKNLHLDSTPPVGYFSNAPDTIPAGQNYVVTISGASDGQGSGVAAIFLDVFTNVAQEPVSPQNSMIGITEPGIYYYRYFAVDNLGNRGAIKTDTTVVMPLISQSPIYPVPPGPEVAAGQEFWLAIVVGNEQEPVNQLSRVSFVLNYTNSQFIDVISDSILPGSLLGDNIDFSYQAEDVAGKVTISIAQKAGETGASGYGTVSRVKFRSDPDTPDQSSVRFSFTSIAAYDVQGFSIELIPGEDSVTIVQPIYDFTMVVEPESQELYPGETAEVMATFTPLGAFNAKVSVEISDVPDEMQAIYPEQPFDIPNAATIQFQTSDRIAPGIYQPVIVATGGGISHQQRITIHILEPVSLADFSLAVQPDSQSIFQGEAATFMASLQPSGGFDAPVTLTITNLPAGMNASYPTDPITIPASVEIEFATESNVEPGVYYPLITATGGGITKHVNVKITVLPRIDFIMIIRPDSQSVVAGESIDFEISFIPVGGFNAKITVAISNIPEGVEAIFTSRPFDIPMTFNITFRVPNNVPPDSYYPIVTGSGGGITHQQTVIIHVLPRGSSTQLFGVQPNPFTPNNDGFNDYAIFNLPETLRGTATIIIFDVAGRKIRELRNIALWDGKDDKGRDMRPGAYIYMIKDGDKVLSKGVVSLAR